MNPNRWLINETKKWTSTLKKLRNEGKTTEEFEILLNNLTLEELIAIKLELSSKTLGSPLFGIPIWNHLQEIVEDAVIKFAVSTTVNTAEAASFLGMTQSHLWKLIKKYQIWNYFDPIYYRKPKAKAKSASNNQPSKENQSNDS